VIVPKFAAPSSELKLRRGDDALAIVKSTEIMIAREAEADDGPVSRRK
jgi:molybdopterin-binding protein